MSLGRTGDTSFGGRHRWRRNTRTAYRDCQNSFGVAKGIIDRKFECWTIIGPALEDFNEIGRLIQKELNDTCDPLHDGNLVTFEAFMIGKDKKNAAPTILFLCPDRDARRKVEKAVIQSGILDKFPGFVTGNRKAPPEGRTILIAANVASTHDALPPDSLREVFFEPPSSDISPNMAIFVTTDYRTYRKATGNLVFTNEKYGCLTVSHIFLKEAPDPPDDDDDETLELSYGSGEEEADETSRGSISSDEGTPSEHSSQSRRTSLIFSPTISQSHNSPSIDPPKPELEGTVAALDSETDQPSSPQYLGLRESGSVDKDWALVCINNDAFTSQLESDYDFEASHAVVASKPISGYPRVCVCSPHGLLWGNIHEAPLFMKLPYSNSFQELYKVQLDNDVRKGDCGSLVVEESTGNLYGYIVASAEDACIAYVMAAHHILGDVIGTDWRLAIPARSESPKAKLYLGNLGEETGISTQPTQRSGLVESSSADDFQASATISLATNDLTNPNRNAYGIDLTQPEVAESDMACSSMTGISELPERKYSSPSSSFKGTIAEDLMPNRTSEKAPVRDTDSSISPAESADSFLERIYGPPIKSSCGAPDDITPSYKSMRPSFPSIPSSDDPRSLEKDVETQRHAPTKSPLPWELSNTDIH